MKNKINIPIFISNIGCENRCSFCNQHKITGSQFYFDKQQIKTDIEMILATASETCEIEIAYFGGSFTAIPLELQKELLEIAQFYVEKDKRIQGIRFSTRPDALGEAVLKQLREYSVKTIEIGVQSFDDTVLAANNRGYTRPCIKAASDIIKSEGYQLGIQLMPGLRKASFLSDALSIDEMCAIKPDFIRFYPTLVIEDTELATLYRNGLYIPLDLEDAIKISQYALKQCEIHGILVIRMGLYASMELRDSNSVLAGPFHCAFKERVLTEVWYAFFKNFSAVESLMVEAHQSLISQMVGDKKINKERLKHLNFKINNTIDKTRIYVNGQQYKITDIIANMVINKSDTYKNR